MSDRSLPHPRLFLVPALLGIYAAAIALAPSRSIAVALAAPLAAVPLLYFLLLKRDRWLPLFFAAALLLPPLPLGLGDSGPHPAVVLVLFGLLAGLLSPGGWRVPATRLNRAFGVFFLILLASSAEAFLYSGARVGMGSLMRVGLLGISVYVFFYTAYGPGSREPVVAVKIKVNVLEKGIVPGHANRTRAPQFSLGIA